MMYFLQFLICLVVSGVLATLFYNLGRKAGYAQGERYSDTRYQDGKRAGYNAAYHEVYDKGYADGWAYRKKRMGGGQ